MRVRRAALAVAAVLLAGCTTGDPSTGSTGSGGPGSGSAGTGGDPFGTAAGRRPEQVRDPGRRMRPVDRELLAAAWRDDLPAARRLVAAGADVNAADDSRQSAFLVAASEGYVELLDLALAHGADVRALDSFRGTALIRAGERGHTLVVGRLLRAGVTVGHVNDLGWTALHEAVLLGDGSERYRDTVRVLLARGADPDQPGSAPGREALADRAEQAGAADVAALIRATARTGPADPDAALLAAAQAGDADAAVLALRAGAGLETRDARRRTPLLLASAADRTDVARLLVALGADPDAVDDQRDTPWLVTGVTGSVAMLEILLPAGPDLTLRNRYGGVSVIPASERGHVDYVRRVVSTGIDVNHVNDLGWTALLEAVILGDGSTRYQEIVRVLLDAGADRTIADRDGVTALEHAEQKGQTEVAALLR
jgi:uncharacterized protein